MVSRLRRYTFPLVLAILTGIVRTFVGNLGQIVDSGYLRRHTYGHAAQEMSAGMNHSVLIMAGLFYCTWFVFLIGGRLHGKARTIYAAVVALVAAAIVCLQLQMPAVLSHSFDGMDASTLRDAVQGGVVQIGGAVLVVVAGAFTLRYLRRKDQVDEIPVPHIVPGGLWSGLIEAADLLKRQTVLFVVTLILFVGLNAVSAVFRAQTSSALKSNPNIVFIMVDTLRSDHLGCYGYSRNTSPNIDKLARQGMRFSKAISQAPWTTASVASFMTSRYLRISNSGNVRGPHYQSVVTSDTPLLSEMLKERGYSTAAVISNPGAGQQFGFYRGYDSFEEIAYGSRTSPQVLSLAMQRLQKLKDKRFFMFVLFMDVHSPYILEKKHQFYTGYKGQLGTTVDVSGDIHGWSDDDLRYVESLYDGGIAYTDEYVGKLLENLKQMNLYNDTLIVFLADHGEEFYEHGGLFHGRSLYDELISVPLIIKLPGQNRGSVVRGDYPLINLVPSVMSYLHYGIAGLGLQGKSVQFDGLKSVRPTTIYSSNYYDQYRMEGLRSSTYKYVVDLKTGKDRLFNLVRDPNEKVNIAGTEKGIADAFRNELKERNSVIDAAMRGIHQSGTPKLTKATRDRLRSLGYAQ